MTDNTIMESLHNYLPKDLVNIFEEYSKDRTNYDKVLREFETSIIITTSLLWIWLLLSL